MSLRLTSYWLFVRVIFGEWERIRLVEVKEFLNIQFNDESKMDYLPQESHK